ncbi:MAG: cysteine desulfurase [Gemmatimonadales bacterium]|nr:cysteine desulfurase [Gemmatimonadales bacterium]MBA3555534.1 cysteine desulfurase [Gemmatimonadales bacterium]
MPRGPAAPLPRWRSDFPILSTTVRGKPLVYLDNAATSQKPRAVIDAMSEYYTSGNANIHRGLHYLSEQATVAFENVREKVAGFLGAESSGEIVFTRGTTEAINLVAASWGRSSLRAGDEVLVTGMEHHSNLVPWQLLCEATGAVLRAVPVTDSGELDLEALHRYLTPRTRIFAFVHLSNVLGTINPVARLVAQARSVGAVTLVDGAQAAPHLPLNVQTLGCDFFAFSGHKIFGPTGIGVLYGRRELLEGMPPWQGGGSMIASVGLERSTWALPPARFEAGTPPIAEVIGLGAALDYVETIGLEQIGAWEAELLARATEKVAELPGIRIIGTAREKASVLSFAVEGIHPHDVGAVLDDDGVAVRAGHHCAQPLMERFGVPAMVRASFAFYNTLDDVAALAAGLVRVRKVFG